MFALISVKHADLEDAVLTNGLDSLFVNARAQQSQLVTASAALTTLGLADHVWYAFQPTATSGAFCIRQKRNQMDVVVDPLNGPELFRACEEALRDLNKVFLEVSGVHVFNKRVPLIGMRAKFSAIDVYQSNSHLSGIAGAPNSWWREITSYAKLKTLLPAFAK